MSVKTIILCDECGAERKEVNHWFSAITVSGKRWAFIPLGDVTPDISIRHDLCGQKCATDAFQRLLVTGSVQKNKEAA